MESVIRGLLVYLFLLVVFRFSGRRMLSEMTAFDLILVMIVSETTQQALVGSDGSMLNAAIVIITLVSANIGLSFLKLRVPFIDSWLGGRPFVIVENGKCFKDRMAKARVDERDVMEAARQLQGLERMDQIKYAVLERGGRITVIPKSDTTRDDSRR